MFSWQKIFLVILTICLIGVSFSALAVDDSLQVDLQVTCPGGDCSGTTDVYGCTDFKANNYNPLATIDNGNCEYTPPGCVGDCRIRGCTDPEASNYNRRAEVNDGSCRYPIYNVTDFVAVYESGPKDVLLTWQNPPQDFQAVRIVRGEGQIPAGPDDGILIYDGSGQTTHDANVVTGMTYFYLALVRNRQGNYSSGAVAMVHIPTAEEEIEEIETGTTISPFSLLPVASSTLPFNWRLWVRQVGELEKYLGPDMTAAVRGDKALTIGLDYIVAPTVLKTIGATLVDPTDKNKSFSFLLRANEDKTAYIADLAPLFKNGTYPIYFYLVDYRDQTVKQVSGKLIVSQMAVISFAPLFLILQKIAAPLAIAAGLIAGLLPNLPSLSDLLVYILRFLGYLFGWRKRTKPWGTVYDAVTKRPLDPAYVMAKKDGKDVASAITDIDGRFGFFLPVGVYQFSANKTHYRFPSVKLAGRQVDEIYDNLYFGGPVSSRGEEVINLNIPMDPIDFDWNEFAKTKKDFFLFYSKNERLKSRIFRLIFAIGFVVTTIVLLIDPSVWNLIFFFAYVAMTLFNTYWKAQHRAWRIYRERTNEPLPFAIIRLFLPGVDQQIKNVVADQIGRFYVLVRPGTYYYTVEEKLDDGSYRKVYQSPPQQLTKGVFTRDVVLKENEAWAETLATVDADGLTPPPASALS